jgi:Bacterial antitoxin of type II TA system, VapB
VLALFLGQEARAGDIIKLIDLGAKIVDNGIMKTTVDIPDSILKEAMGFTKARTKRQAIVTALEDFNHRRRMAALIKHGGTCAGFMSAAEVKTLRRKG